MNSKLRKLSLVVAIITVFNGLTFGTSYKDTPLYQYINLPEEEKNALFEEFDRANDIEFIKENMSIGEANLLLKPMKGEILLKPPKSIRITDDYEVSDASAILISFYSLYYSQIFSKDNPYKRLNTSSYSHINDKYLELVYNIENISLVEQKELDEMLKLHYSELDKVIGEFDSDAEKLVKIINYFSYILYDDETPLEIDKNNNMYGALKYGATKCLGYSELIRWVGIHYGLKIEIATGVVFDTKKFKYIEQDENRLWHAWNVIKLGEKWYHVDTTFYYDVFRKLEKRNEVEFDLAQNGDTLKMVKFKDNTWNMENLIFSGDKAIISYGSTTRLFLTHLNHLYETSQESIPYPYEKIKELDAIHKMETLYLSASKLGAQNDFEVIKLREKADRLLDGYSTEDNQAELKRLHSLIVSTETLIVNMDADYTEVIRTIKEANYGEYDVTGLFERVDI